MFVMNVVNRKNKLCPECGGKLASDGECEDCDYVENAIAKDLRAVRPELHAVAGASAKAAARHRKAAAEHDAAALDLHRDGDSHKGHLHDVAAEQHRWAAKRHGGDDEENPTENYSGDILPLPVMNWRRNFS